MENHTARRLLQSNCHSKVKQQMLHGDGDEQMAQRTKQSCGEAALLLLQGKPGVCSLSLAARGLAAADFGRRVCSVCKHSA